MPKKEIVFLMPPCFSFSGILSRGGGVLSQTKKHEENCCFACDVSGNNGCPQRLWTKCPYSHKPSGLPQFWNNQC